MADHNLVWRGQRYIVEVGADGTKRYLDADDPCNAHYVVDEILRIPPWERERRDAA